MATVPEQLEQLTKDKTKLSEVLSVKGVEASPSETFTTLVPKINNIKGICINDATIQGGDVLDGKIAYNNEGRIVGYDRERNMSITENSSSMTTIMNQDGKFCGCITKFPVLDLSKLNTAYKLFHSCRSLQEGPTLINTSQIRTFEECFKYCTSMVTMPEIDTSGATNIKCMFIDCYQLKTVPALDCSKVTAVGNGPIFSGNRTTNIGGFINLGKAYSNTAAANTPNYCLYLNNDDMYSLTIESMFNIANGLYDLNINGVAEQSVHLIAYCYDKFQRNERWDELVALIESKGWKLVRHTR